MDTKVGMGLLLFRKIKGEWKIFIIKELKSKPVIFKKAGMFSFPLETQKFGENDEDNLRRLVKEETPYSWNQIDLLGIAEEKLLLIPGREDIHMGYGFGFFNEDAPETLKKTSIDPDIEVIGWKSLGIFFNGKNPLRIETRPIWMHFLKNYTESVLED